MCSIVTFGERTASGARATSTLANQRALQSKNPCKRKFAVPRMMASTATATAQPSARNRPAIPPASFDSPRLEKVLYTH